MLSVVRVQILVSLFFKNVFGFAPDLNSIEVERVMSPRHNKKFQCFMVCVSDISYGFYIREFSDTRYKVCSYLFNSTDCTSIIVELVNGDFRVYN